MSNELKKSTEYIIVLLKWITISIIVGIIGGVLGSVFHITIDKATQLRYENQNLLYFLPLGGVLIAGMYHFFISKGKIDTDRVIDSIRKNNNIPIIMIPLIYLGTTITHLFGGSAGREGAALQLGGSVGYNIGKLFKLGEKSMKTIIMSGMASVFSALFATPVTAAIFAVEVVTVGKFHYLSFLSCMVSSVVAFMMSKFFGLSGVRFSGVIVEELNILSVGKIIILAVLCALVSILFCSAIKLFEKITDKVFHNAFIKAFTGGVLIIVLTLLVNSYDYNGTGMEVINNAISGQAKPEAFILKILFTVITIQAGFKGGEIIPSFFIGSTFGCVIAPFLGLSPSFAACIGFVSVFCGVVNCPIASIILSIEVFGADGLIFFALASGISYLMSGDFGLYKTQKLRYSKLSNERIDIYTK